MARIKQSRWTFIALVIIETLIFGSGNAITKMAYDSITPFWCLTIRFGLATAVFALFFGPRIFRSLRKARVAAWLPAAVCMAVSYICCNVALDFTSATTVGFLVALPVVFTPILSSVFNRSKYPLAFLPFQCAVVAGLYLLCSNGGELTFGVGEILALASSVALAGALVFGQKGVSELDALSVAGSQIGMSFLLSLFCALIFEAPVALGEVTPFAWSTIAFLALLSTCLTFLLQNLALEKLPSTTVSLLLTGEPVFTAIFSYVLLGETLSAMGFVGAGLIVGSVVLATYVEGRQSAKTVPSQGEAQPQLAKPLSVGELAGTKVATAASSITASTAESAAA